MDTIHLPAQQPTNHTRTPLGQQAPTPDTARAIARILPTLGKNRVEVAAFQSSI